MQFFLYNIEMPVKLGYSENSVNWHNLLQSHQL